MTLSEIPEENPETFPSFSEEYQQDLVRKRMETNAKSVTRSRRIRWSLRYTILICGAIIAAAFYFEPESQLITGLACFSFFLLLASATILFSMGGLAPGKTRLVLSKKQKQRLDD